jgi:hypothetical protein
MASKPDPKRGGPAEVPPRRAGQTARTRDPQRPLPPSGNADAKRMPKAPHERDESSASQQSAPRDVIRQAHDDVEQGRRDTSRGEATDETYAREFRDGDTPAGATGEAAPKRR